MSNLILADTNIWIERIHRPTSEVSITFQNLIKDMRICLTGIVVAEFIQGVKSDKMQKEVSNAFKALPFINTTYEDWLLAGELLIALRKKGIKIPKPDAVIDGVIASICINNDIELYTLDKHFDHFKGLKRFNP